MTTTKDNPNLPVIMIVDNDLFLRKLIITHLQQMKCKVLEASDGETALAKILMRKPDLLLLDVMMPQLTGWEIVKYLRNRPKYNDMGIIMVTAIGKTLNDMTSPLYGADEHIDKPFKFAQLEFKIRKALSGKRHPSKVQRCKEEREERLLSDYYSLLETVTTFSVGRSLIHNNRIFKEHSHRC